jgi:hypothetical protein
VVIFLFCSLVFTAHKQEAAIEEALLHEQQKNGKILMQLVVMTNELNERDSQIALLKKKEEHYEQTLQERENLFKQDTMARMQLGKRLEQVLMDKEEALDQLEVLRVSICELMLCAQSLMRCASCSFFNACALFASSPALLNNKG